MSRCRQPSWWSCSSPMMTSASTSVAFWSENTRSFNFAWQLIRSPPSQYSKRRQMLCSSSETSQSLMMLAEFMVFMHSISPSRYSRRCGSFSIMRTEMSFRAQSWPFSSSTRQTSPYAPLPSLRLFLYLFRNIRYNKSNLGQLVLSGSLDADEHLGFDARAVGDAAPALSVGALDRHALSDHAPAAQDALGDLAVVLNLHVVQQNGVDQLHVLADLAPRAHTAPPDPGAGADADRLHHAGAALELRPLVQPLGVGRGHEHLFLFWAADDAVEVHGLVDLLGGDPADVGVLVAEVDEDLQGRAVAVGEGEQADVGLVFDEELDQVGLDLVDLFVVEVEQDAGHPAAEDVGPGVHDPAETAPSHDLEDGGVDLHAFVLYLLHHVHEEALVVFPNQDVVDIRLQLSLRQLLLLLAQLPLGLGHQRHLALPALVEQQDVLQGDCVDCIGVLHDVSLIDLFLVEEDLFEGKGGVGQILGGPELDAVRVLPVGRQKLRLDELLQEAVLL